MKKTILFFSIILMPLFTYGQTHQDDVARILKTLSADDMKGRQAFSPEIWEAADFIANEFEEIGLEPLQTEDDYLQDFTMNSVAVESANISVGGQTLSDNQYFVIGNGQKIRWSAGDNISVKQIKAGDDFRSKIGEYRNLKEDLIIFVNPSHSDMFGRFRPYFSRPDYQFEDDSPYNKVFILAEKPNDFQINIKKNVEEKKLANVAGMIEGKRSDEIVVFSGHYDHIGIREPAQVDSIANGANDDASGTTAVIELARHFAQMDQPERTLIFVAFTAEEVGGFGSQYFSRQLNPDDIVAMFNIEMIGKPATDGPNSAWITGFDRSSFGKLLQESTEGTEYTFYADPYPNQNLFYRSDNATLARLGVPAHSISTTPIDVDEDYHQVSDEFGTINLSHLTNTIDAIAKAAEGIISGKDTPTRVDKNLVD